MLLPFCFSFSTYGFVFLHQKQGEKEGENLLMWKKNGNGWEVWGNLSIIKSHIYIPFVLLSHGFTWSTKLPIVKTLAKCSKRYQSFSQTYKMYTLVFKNFSIVTYELSATSLGVCFLINQGSNFDTNNDMLTI